MTTERDCACLQFWNSHHPECPTLHESVEEKQISPPEKLRYQEQSDDYTHIIRADIIRADNRRYNSIFFCQFGQSSKGEESKARRVVLTWNFHDDLVAALEAMCDAHKRLSIYYGTNDPRYVAHVAARAALAKVKGGRF